MLLTRSTGGDAGPAGDPPPADAAATADDAVESYATLINRRLLLPSQRTSYIAVEPHYLLRCLRPDIVRIHVDETWYCRQYPDVVEALAEGKIASAREHYERFGYLEHRIPYRIEVHEEWYLAQYDDIRRAVAGGEFASGQQHFIEVGYREGRFPHPNFRLRLTGRRAA